MFPVCIVGSASLHIPSSTRLRRTGINLDRSARREIQGQVRGDYDVAQHALPRIGQNDFCLCAAYCTQHLVESRRVIGRTVTLQIVARVVADLGLQRKSSSHKIPRVALSQNSALASRYHTQLSARSVPPADT